MSAILLKQSITASLNQLEVPTYTETETKRAQDISIVDDDIFRHSAFGDLYTNQKNFIITGGGQYDLLPANFRSFSGSSGAATVENREFKVATSSTIGSYGTLQSFRSINHKLGESSSVRFNAVFNTPTALTESGAGAVSLGDEISYGYNGINFGVWYRRGGISEKRILTLTAGSSGATSATININSEVYTVPLTAGSTALNAKEIAAYVTANSATWYAEQLGAAVYFSSTTEGVKSGTYSFSHATATGSFSQLKAGVTKTSTHVPTSDFSESLPTNFSASDANTYEIIYKSGDGVVWFYIEDKISGKMRLVHRYLTGSGYIKAPSMRVGCYVYSTGSTTPITLTASYFSAGFDGKDIQSRNPRGFSNTKTSVGTAPTNLLTIRNKRVYNGYFNQSEIEPLAFTAANDGTKSAVFELRGNATVAGSPNFQNVASNLISEYDTAGTDVSGGSLLASFVVAKGQSIYIDLKSLSIRLPPTISITITGYMASGTADLTTGLVWLEDI